MVLFATFRLVYILSGRSKDWVLVFGIVLDMVFLIGLIFSFHIQYGQAPAFSLRAPAIVYTFIFIALRALRFNAQHVLLAGMAACTGWLLLVYYVISRDDGSGGGSSIRTRDYVEYLNSTNTVLYGAEAEKILAIFVVTLVLCVALIRAHRILTRAVMEQFAAADLSRFFDADVAAQIRKSGQALTAGQGEFRECAIMFIDLRGFTPLSQQLEPNELIKLLGEYQSKVVPVIRRHHGAIDKFMGDGIMATFGAVIPLESHTAHAIRAADDLMAAAEKWRAERQSKGLPAPGIGCAVADGKVTAGVIGHEDRLEFTVIGDAVNLAAKLEKHTKQEKCAALTTRALLDAAIKVGYEAKSPKIILTKRNVGGVPEPIDLCVIA